MIDYVQVPTLYIIASIGLTCGFAALAIAIITNITAKRNRRFLKTLVQGMELLLASQEKTAAEQTETKAYLIKTLRELEHDHDKFKDVLDGYSQTLARIEGVTRQVKDNQNNYLIKGSTHTGSSNNKIKVNSPPPPDMYNGQLVNALLSQLIDKMQRAEKDN